ncbi:hypothetical protein TWF730_011249 [Orbilia blumenaviensis]|uniref:Uncharacterized protein n=1 Tax=Orbilia blumenaviensis TaxID=1796055 RepID=A0AAV9UJX0_9PEZI
MCTRIVKKCFQCRYFAVLNIKYCPGKELRLYGACVGWTAERSWYNKCPACCRRGYPPGQSPAPSASQTEQAAATDDADSGYGTVGSETPVPTDDDQVSTGSTAESSPPEA